MCLGIFFAVCVKVYFLLATNSLILSSIQQILPVVYYILDTDGGYDAVYRKNFNSRKKCSTKGHTLIREAKGGGREGFMEEVAFESDMEK